MNHWLTRTDRLKDVFFLLALATAARVSEIHVNRVQFERLQNGKVFLGLCWDLIMKNQLPGQPDHLFTILSLVSILSPDDHLPSWSTLYLPPDCAPTSALPLETLHPPFYSGHNGSLLYYNLRLASSNYSASLHLHWIASTCDVQSI